MRHSTKLMPVFPSPVSIRAAKVARLDAGDVTLLHRTGSGTRCVQGSDTETAVGTETVITPP